MHRIRLAAKQQQPADESPATAAPPAPPKPAPAKAKARTPAKKARKAAKRRGA